MMATLVVLGASLACGCVDPMTTNAKNTPEWTAKNVRGYGETALGPAPDVAYGWDLRVAAGVARWRECTSPEACTEIERECPAADLLSFTRAGRIASDGGDVEVMKLSLTPRKKYVVPTKPP